MRISPIPFVISEILFSNIGGTATLIGDPPNIMIGVAAGLSFMDFIQNLLPVILVISVVVISLLRFIYFKHFKQELVKTHIESFDEKRSITDKGFFVKTMVIFALVIAGFMTPPFTRKKHCFYCLRWRFCDAFSDQTDSRRNFKRGGVAYAFSFLWVCL